MCHIRRCRLAKGPKFQFKLEKGGLGAKAAVKFQSYNPLPQKPTDANQKAPTVANPVSQRVQLAGGG